MGSTVAMKGHGDRGVAGFNGGHSIAGLGGLRIHAAGIFAVSVGTQGDHKSKRNEAPQQTGFAGAFSGFAQAIRFFGRAGGTHNALCLLFPVLANSDLERKTLTEAAGLFPLGKHARQCVVMLDVVMIQGGHRMQADEEIACCTHDFMQFLELLGEVFVFADQRG
jgi:hypothetical protein